MADVIKLRVVTGSEARGFIVPATADGAPAFTGTFDATYLCGGCDRVLCSGVRRGVFSALLFECACGAMNRVA